MLLGRVIGTLVPSLVVDELAATPLLWIQPLDREGRPEGDPLVCADGTRMAGRSRVKWLSRITDLSSARNLARSDRSARASASRPGVAVVTSGTPSVCWFRDVPEAATRRASRPAWRHRS